MKRGNDSLYSVWKVVYVLKALAGMHCCLHFITWLTRWLFLHAGNVAACIQEGQPFTSPCRKVKRGQQVLD